jgi:hypothetical protein
LLQSLVPLFTSEGVDATVTTAMQAHCAAARCLLFESVEGGLDTIRHTVASLVAGRPTTPFQHMIDSKITATSKAALERRLALLNGEGEKALITGSFEAVSAVHISQVHLSSASIATAKHVNPIEREVRVPSLPFSSSPQRPSVDLLNVVYVAPLAVASDGLVRSFVTFRRGSGVPALVATMRKTSAGVLVDYDRVVFTLAAGGSELIPDTGFVRIHVAARLRPGVWSVHVASRFDSALAPIEHLGHFSRPLMVAETAELKVLGHFGSFFDSSWVEKAQSVVRSELHRCNQSASVELLSSAVPTITEAKVPKSLLRSISVQLVGLDDQSDVPVDLDAYVVVGEKRTKVTAKTHVEQSGASRVLIADFGDGEIPRLLFGSKGER